jgi:hypothetical protein
MKRKRRGLGVVAAGGAWCSGGTDLDWRQRLFDSRWKEGEVGQAGPGGLDAKAD